jgi:hypothetical protein
MRGRDKGKRLALDTATCHVSNQNPTSERVDNRSGVLCSVRGSRELPPRADSQLAKQARNRDHHSSDPCGQTKKQLTRSIVNDASQSAAAGIDTRSSKSIFDSVSQTPPLRMHSAIASVASA